jgi:hypothetical protein
MTLRCFFLWRSTYIASQVAEGWPAPPARYYDGGFSGGNMERPGLKQLLADIALCKIDIVVVLRLLDALTRGLRQDCGRARLPAAARADMVPAPDIRQAILDGRHPLALNFERLMRLVLDELGQAAGGP